MFACDARYAGPRSGGFENALYTGCCATISSPKDLHKSCETAIVQNVSSKKANAALQGIV